MRTWAIRIVAVVGVVLTGYLSVHSWSGPALAGCGAGSACDQVLASRWSQWLGLPVAVIGLGIWLVILASAFVERAKPVLVAAALLAGGAAVWFVLIQKVRLDAFCPYCMAAHGCALVLLFLVIRNRQAFTVSGTLAATAGLTVMVGGQLFFPSPSSALIAYEAQDSKIEVAPVVGNPRAEHVLVTYFDYTCPYCRQMHGFLEQARQRYGNQIALALAPVPMDADCNPTYDQTPPKHKNGCELARLALAVWNARPERFAQINAFLFKGDSPPSPDAARRFAEDLVDPQHLKRALNAPFIDALIAAKVRENTRIGKRTNNGGLLPKVVTSEGFLLIGRTRSAQKLFDVLESRLGVKPVKSSQGNRGERGDAEDAERGGGQ